ncbi:hypothetical protein DFJ58DRAFT_667718, partial [Suillus subalutaceus]|uniref:uncharacterized protein n=1 Tax=Suillus subalutaceus TaxID=48586 RepID=UPI001B87905F
MSRSITLEQILSVLRSSSVPEERSNDVKSNFWASYKKAADEYDDAFLERAHDNIGVILNFAGLLSVVISTFIGGMQPDSGDTTNALLVQLIQVSVDGPSAVDDISNLSSTTGYSSSTVWAQTLAYIGLALSMLAAFGAVVGKQ